MTSRVFDARVGLLSAPCLQSAVHYPPDGRLGSRAFLQRVSGLFTGGLFDHDFTFSGCADGCSRRNGAQAGGHCSDNYIKQLEVR